MLMLGRKIGESFMVGNAKITITKARGNRLTVAIDAPKDVPVRRLELKENTGEQCQDAA